MRAPPHPAPPAAPGHLVLARGVPLRDAIVAAVADILAYAADAAAGAAVDPERAVHEYRKAVRRARAVVRMVRRLVAADRHAALLATLGAAHRVTSELRDTDVLLGVARDVRGRVRGKELGLAVDRFGALLEARQWAQVASERAARLLARRAPALARIADELAGVVAPEVGWDDLERGLRDGFRRARRALERSRHDGDDESFHDWRKVSKELAYQLELVGTGAGGRADRLRDRFADLAEAQGEVTDLLIFRDHVRRTPAGEPDRRIARLLRWLDRASERNRRRAERAGEALLGRSPKKLATQAIALAQET